MLSGSDDGFGGGLSCPEDRCTNYYCAGGFLRVLREWSLAIIPNTLKKFASFILKSFSPS
jgi:hypothetical protein